MFKQSIKRLSGRLSGVTPRVAIAGALIIVVIVSGAALLLSRGGSEAIADTSMQPLAARLDRIDGSVAIARAEDEDKQLDWAEATLNTPVTVGDRIYARDYAHASIALTGHNYVRLNPATSVDVLALEERRTQLALRSGSALFDVGALASDELFEVATPCGAVDFKQPGLYQIGMDGGNAVISVLNGLAQVVGQEGTGYISKGQVFTLTGATATEALASTLASSTAGEIVDDYYRYRYPKVYNGRYRSYDAYLADPSYYDPYRTSVSYQYLSADIPGLYDLDYYGDWVDVGDYGHCWAPRVSAGWAPFRSGYWDLDDLWGPSWISSEPWGWAPYHYGRWAFVNQRWFWVPVEVRTRAVYCPAPVAFIPFADQIAWVPLGPGEVYVARYYDNFRPRYLASAEVVRVVSVQNTFVNFNAPGAVTVVPVQSLTRVIDPRAIAPADAGVVKGSRAVLDPFSVAGVRELAIRRDDGRRRIKFDRREQETLNTAVVASVNPEALPSRGDIAKRLRVEAAPENRKANKLKIREMAEVTTSGPDGLPQSPAQSQRMSELASRAERGDKSARREMRQLMREQQRALNPPAPPQQAQREQSRQEMKQQQRTERQQQSAAAQQAQQQQQMKQQRRAERQQQTAAAAQQAQQQQQMKQQRRAERQQQSAAAAQREQNRQHQQMRQQRKEQRRKPPEASLQRQVRPAQQEAARQTQTAQLKAQRRAQQGALSAEVNRRTVIQPNQQAQAREQLKAQRRAQQQALPQQQRQPAHAQAVQRQASPAAQPAPGYQRPPVRQDAGSQSARRGEKAQRKPPQ